MALPPTSNAGTKYFNINQCRSFTMELDGDTLTCLSGANVGGSGVGLPCSEVTVRVPTPQGDAGPVTIYDNNHYGGEYGFAIREGEQFTFRGLTNVNEVSAEGPGGGSYTIEYRAQFFSSNTSTS